MVSRLRVRFPDVAIGDIYEQPDRRRARDLPRRHGRVRPDLGPHRAADAAEDPDRARWSPRCCCARWPARAGWSGSASPATSLASLVGLSWLPAARRGGCSPRAGSPSCRRRGGCWSPRASPACCCCPVDAGRAPARRPDPPSALAGAARHRPARARAGSRGAPWMTWYARLLGARIGRDVDLHSLPPVTGMLRLGRGCSIEPEVDLSGFWIDGDVAPPRAGAGRSPGPGRRPEHALPGCRRSARTPRSRRARRSSAPVPEGEYWSGLPGRRRSPPRPAGPGRTGPRTAASWVAAYGAVGGAALAAAGPGPGRRARRCRCWSPTGRRATPTCSPSGRGCRCPPWSVCLVIALLVWAVVRVAALAITHRRASGAQPAGARGVDRRCGCSTRPAPGSSRSTPRC